MANGERPGRVARVVITVDGLRAAALGAYGQTAYETPAFDALAAKGRTHDWCYARTPDPRDSFQELARSAGGTGIKRLVTDDVEVTEPLHGATRRVDELNVGDTAEPALAVELTSTAARWQQFAAAIADDPPDDGETAWLHTLGLYGPWDAPTPLAASLRDEDDPDIEPDASPPAANVPPNDDDARFAAACRYAAEVMVLDACLASWLEVAGGAFEGRDWELVVAGVRGFPLGEHGRIGGVDPRLWSEQQHIPLLVVSPDHDGLAFTRSDQPVTLASGIGGIDAGAGLQLGSTNGAKGFIEGDRFLRLPGADEANAAPELYVKPDDRWEQNDIAKLEPERVDDMLAELATKDSDVATPESPA